MIEAFQALFAPPRHYILLVAALWIGLALAEKRSERHGVSKEQLNNLAFNGLIAYILGGRFLFALSHFSAFSQSPLSVFSPNPDLFDPIGGLVVAVLVGLIYGQRQGLPLWGTLDALTPIYAMLFVGLALAALAVGTGFGAQTSLPWGVDQLDATRHPVLIYELLASLLIFGWLWLRKSDSSGGHIFLTFAAMTAGARLFLEAFRGDSVLVFGEFRLAQVIAWAVLVVVFFASESIRQRGKAN